VSRFAPGAISHCQVAVVRIAEVRQSALPLAPWDAWSMLGPAAAHHTPHSASVGSLWHLVLWGPLASSSVGFQRIAQGKLGG